MAELYSQKYTLEKGWQTLFKDLNIASQDVLQRAQLPLDLLLQKAPSVTADEYYRFWDSLARSSKNEANMALSLVKTISSYTLAPPIIAFLSSDNLTIALKRIAHYKPVVAPIRMTVEANDHYTSLRFFALAEQGALPNLFVAFELMFWLELARVATREEIVPEAVYSSLDLTHTEVYESYFKTDIRYDQVNQIIFSSTDAQKPFLTSNQAMWAVLEPVLDKRMEHLTQDACFRDRVRACLVEILASGQYSMSYVASKLAVSSRTLQRRLSDEGTSFQKVLNELREELACHYLAETDYSSAEISFLLGYEEPNSFFRAFRAWTGQTPEFIRANRT